MEIESPSLLIDANLLVLLAVGGFDRSLIGRKRLDVFTAHFEKLLNLAGRYPRHLTTPHLLTELANLSDQCVPEQRHGAFRAYLARFIRGLNEHWTEAAELTALPVFLRVGLSDTAVVQLADKRTTVITTDVRLCNLLLENGIDAINFNWLRGDE